MKKLLLPLFATALLFAACKTKEKDSLDTENRIVFTDTAAASNANASTDVGTKDTTPIVVADKVAEPKVQVRTITKVVKVYEKQPAPRVVKKEPTTTLPDSDPFPTTTPGSTAGTGTGTTGAGTTTPAKKKNTGWSDAAKDATIGGVGGAVIGGVIGKGGKGAVIGGVIGAAGGYILGRKKDRRSGRIDTTKN